MCVPSSTGSLNSAEGGIPKLTACIMQNGQCSKWVVWLTGSGDCLSLSICTSLLPLTEQISTHVLGALLAAAIACETDGASAAIRIAHMAIHNVRRCMACDILIADDDFQ